MRRPSVFAVSIFLALVFSGVNLASNNSHFSFEVPQLLPEITASTPDINITQAGPEVHAYSQGSYVTSHETTSPNNNQVFKSGIQYVHW